MRVGRAFKLLLFGVGIIGVFALAPLLFVLIRYYQMMDGPGSASPAPVAPPTVRHLAQSDIDTLRAILGPSIEESQQDLFGQLLLRKSDSELESSGDAATIRIFGISSLLLDCKGQIKTGTRTVPFNAVALVEFAAFELTNLAPVAFAQIDDLEMIELLLSAKVTDRYGQVSRQDFFSAAVSRMQAVKMNWRWFRGTIFRGGFDPTAFSKFGVISEDSGSVDNVSSVLKAIQENTERRMEEYGLPDPLGTVWKSSSQLANRRNCALSMKRDQ